jgi:hypothetical protein
MTDTPRFSPTAPQPGTVVAVGTTSTPVITPSGDYDGDEIHLVNDSDTKIYVRLAATGATVGSGIALYPNGGSFSTSYHQGAVCAIHGGTGTKNLCVTVV